MKEQIELIRKDLDSLYEYRQDDFNYIGCHNDITRHLNSIEKMSQNILKYKKCECGCDLFLPTQNKKIKRCLVCKKEIKLDKKEKVEIATTI